VQKILIIEDDRTFSKILETFLKKKGFAIDCCYDLKSGEKFIQENKVDLILLDFRLPDGIGLDLISKIGDSLPTIPAIIITSFNDVRTAVKSLQSGAFEYIIKPVKPDELLLVIQAVFNQKKEKLIEPIQKSIPPIYIEGKSSASKKLYEFVDLVAPTDMSVMIIGETGTGKEHIAKRIHDLSNRKDHAFVALDCGVLSNELAGSELFGHEKGAFTGAVGSKEGMFLKANGGTLFLDEIGNLSYDVQIKLLRSLQERTIIPIGSSKSIPVDIRLITATNENLIDEIDAGNFRMDLYHRINEFKIQIPALRDRGEDLQDFVSYFIQQANEELSKHVVKISEKGLAVFLNYDWPGNLRELKNVVKRMVLLCQSDIADETLLPDEMKYFTPEKKRLKRSKT
jgi:two-component system, NtrC family, response regulator HydG